jgi:hypothetical protein
MRRAFWLAVGSLVACADTPPPETPADATAADPAPVVEVLHTEDGDVAATEANEPTREESGAAPEPLDTAGLPLVCEMYISEFERCLTSVSGKSPEAVESMQRAMRTQREAFEAANSPEARDALRMGCEMSLKAIRDNPACNEPAR